MTFYDYKVAPAPRELKRLKGVSSTDELFAATLSDAINAAAREGWEYLRAEILPATERRGLFRRGGDVSATVLIFRRPRESLGPRLAAAAAFETAPAPEAGGPRLGIVERPVPTALRREPLLADDDDDASPLRAAPRLGPADQL
jgi:hypothetical protein